MTLQLNEIERALVAKLRMQGCTLVETACTAVSLCCELRGVHFFVARCPDGEYTRRQLVYIESELAALELELLPLDWWMS